MQKILIITLILLITAPAFAGGFNLEESVSNIDLQTKNIDNIQVITEDFDDLNKTQRTYAKQQSEEENLNNVLFKNTINSLKSSEDENIWLKRSDTIYGTNTVGADRRARNVDIRKIQEFEDYRVRTAKNFTPESIQNIHKEDVYNPSKVQHTNLRTSLESDPDYVQEQRVYQATESIKNSLLDKSDVDKKSPFDFYKLGNISFLDFMEIIIACIFTIMFATPLNSAITAFCFILFSLFIYSKREIIISSKKRVEKFVFKTLIPYLKNNSMILLSIILLFIALLPLSYGYYIVLKLIICFSCIREIVIGKKDNIDTILLLLAIAVLYNPIVKMPLGKPIWSVANVLTASYFIYYLFKNRRILK